tara:strand:- start:1476 stop:1892 length:417 start_codon:yes stop_codon:yes gene_type:complete
MKKITLSILTIFLFCTCSVDEERIIESPSISIINPTQELYNIGQMINIEILISHNEVIDNITYYETCNCTDDEFDSLELIELKNIYEKEWSYTKSITTNDIPENVMCDYNIEISADDLNGNESVKSIYFHVMTMNGEL